MEHTATIDLIKTEHLKTPQKWWFQWAADDALLKNQQWNVVWFGKHPTIEICSSSLHWEHHNKQAICFKASWQRSPYSLRSRWPEMFTLSLPSSRRPSTAPTKNRTLPSNSQQVQSASSMLWEIPIPMLSANTLQIKKKLKSKCKVKKIKGLK